jgi:hypothetical protein
MGDAHFGPKRTLPDEGETAGESGYAVLLVFLVAAIIAVALYNELPRAAFEAQRDKEQLLIERGEQYKRAIQVFVRKVGRYPATIQELESLNNTRFLRKRYLDPMTGKEKWRLIHINDGVVTDSIIPKTKPGQEQPQANANTFIGEGPTMGAANDPNPPQVNPAMRRRASDDRPVVTQEAPDPPAPADPEPVNADAVNGDNSDSANTPGAPNQQTPGAAAGPVQQPGANPGQPAAGAAAANPQNPSGGGPKADPSSGSGVYVAPSMQSSGSSVYVAPSLGQPYTPSMNPPTAVVGVPGQGDVLGGRDARNLRAIQQNAANAAASGPPGLPAASTGSGLAGVTQIGGGIAGVASESTGPAIKIYNERKKYSEWEFVYDKSKDRGLAGVQRNGGAPGTPVQSMGNAPGQPPGPANLSSGFGQPTPTPPQAQPQQPPPN